MGSSGRKPRIIECYADYNPPPGIATIVEGLLGHVPNELYIGLGEIQLTDSSTLSRAGSRRATSERVPIGQTKALYWPPSLGASARIDIYLDKVLNRVPSPLRRLNLLKEITIAEVLFHELGHHFQTQTKYRLRKSKQEVFAHQCSAMLLRRFIDKKYKFLKPVFAVLNKGLDIRDSISGFRKS